jgi:hypothetical protein
LSEESGLILKRVNSYLGYDRMILEKEGANDRQDMKKILDSFEVIQKR